MYQTKNIDLLIKRIKALTGLNQEGIAKKINYSRPHFSAMKKTNATELYQLLENHFENVLTTKFILREDASDYASADGLTEEVAMLKVLLLEVAKLKSKIFGISVADAIDELEKNITISQRSTSKK